MLILKLLMIVFDVLSFNDSISLGAVAVNDLTHPRKTLYDKSLTFVHPPYSVFKSKNDFIICKQHAAIQKVWQKCFSQS